MVCSKIAFNQESLEGNSKNKEEFGSPANTQRKKQTNKHTRILTYTLDDALISHLTGLTPTNFTHTHT